MTRLHERITEPNLGYVRRTMMAIEHSLSPRRPWDIDLSIKFFGQAEEVVALMNGVGNHLKEGRTGVVVGLIKTGVNPFASFKEVGSDNNINPVAAMPLDRQAVAKHAFMATVKAAEAVQKMVTSSVGRASVMGEMTISETKDAGKVPGGAIVIGRYVMAVSGYATPEMDEVAGLAIASRMVEHGLLNSREMGMLERAYGKEKWAELKPRLVK